MLSFSHLAEVF